MNPCRIINFCLIVYYVLALLFYDWHPFKYIDEILIYGLLGFALFEVFLNSKTLSRPFMIFMGVGIFYTFYSFLIGSNQPIAIWKDLIIQSKPYVVFFSVLLINPSVAYLDKKNKKLMSFFGGIFLVMVGVIQLIGWSTIYPIFGHPSRYATATTLTALLFLWSSEFSKKIL